ncbi:ensconsin-like [Macrobrachium nipponense]|uniref:ensconsin-like n=1 Tax=Macrobrachium nipponense TaxID=159736 RepID=UPI0030C81525
MHGGIQETLATICRQLWIPKGRQAVRKVIRKCVICRKVEDVKMQAEREREDREKREIREREDREKRERREREEEKTSEEERERIKEEREIARHERQMALIRAKSTTPVPPSNPNQGTNGRAGGWWRVYSVGGARVLKLLSVVRANLGTVQQQPFVS